MFEPIRRRQIERLGCTTIRGPHQREQNRPNKTRHQRPQNNIAPDDTTTDRASGEGHFAAAARNFCRGVETNMKASKRSHLLTCTKTPKRSCKPDQRVGWVELPLQLAERRRTRYPS